MSTESVLKLYHHFIRAADVNKYHGNLAVLKTFMRMPESEIKEAINRIREQYEVSIFWFSELDFIADVTGQELKNSG